MDEMIATGEELNKDREGGKAWPETGDKVIFKGVPEFVYPHFTNIIENAKKLLVVGQEYTVSKCTVFSSWCSLELEGIRVEPDEHSFFHFSMFDWKP
jgi:hypothetical protein